MNQLISKLGMYKQRTLRQFPLVFIVGLFFIAAQAFSATFTEPTVAPPNGNVEPPINTSTAAQVKKGALVLNQTAGAAIGLFVPSGRIEIGDRAGAYVAGDDGLAIFGKKFRLADGTQGKDKVLMSSVNGQARWDSLPDGICLQATGVSLPPGYGCAILPNGSMMQWGKNAYLGVQEMVFWSPYKDTNYAITITPEKTVSQNCVPAIDVKKTNSVTFITDDRCTDYWYDWIAIGYPLVNP